MTTEKLCKANELSTRIIHHKDVIKQIKATLKEIELTDYRDEITQLRLDQKCCQLNTDRLIKYLNKELEVEGQTLKDTENKFYSL